jgi:hypothetical protein
MNVVRLPTPKLAETRSRNVRRYVRCAPRSAPITLQQDEERRRRDDERRTRLTASA